MGIHWHVLYRLVQEKEERKKAAIERSRQRQADRDYFKKKMEANTTATTEVTQKIVEVSSSPVKAGSDEVGITPNCSLVVVIVDRQS